MKFMFPFHFESDAGEFAAEITVDWSPPRRSLDWFQPDEPEEIDLISAAIGGNAPIEIDTFCAEYGVAETVLKEAAHEAANEWFER